MSGRMHPERTMGRLQGTSYRKLDGNHEAQYPKATFDGVSGDRQDRHGLGQSLLHAHELTQCAQVVGRQRQRREARKVLE